MTYGMSDKAVRTRRSRACAAAACVLSAWLASGCGTSPAKPDLTRELTPATPTAPPNGEYDLTVHTLWTGPLTGRLIAQPTEQGFKANTPPGVAWALVGGFQGAFGPLLAPFLFPSGMILTWESAMPANGEAGEGSIGVGSRSNLRVKTRIVEPGAPAQVIFRDGRTVAMLELRPSHETRGRMDYPALARRIGEVMPGLVYDPAQATSPAVASYVKEIEEAAGEARDDFEFLFATAMAGRKHIKFQQPLVFPSPTPTGERYFEGVENPPSPWRVAHDEATGLSTLTVNAFIEAEDVDEAMREVMAKSPRGLVLDLRTCPGVEITALRAAAWLLDEPRDVGLVFAARRRAEALKSGSGSEAPVLTLGDDADVEATQELVELMDEQGWAQLRVVPLSQRFEGPVVVLTGRRTTSTAEALTTALRGAPGITLAGEPTAGRPLVSREAQLGDGWVLRVASMDFTPADGQRLQGRGVRPDSRAPSGDAGLAFARRLLTERLQSRAE